jgi:hypothetical protein
MSELTHDANLIIAGTNKSGTTAIFRYLGSHPDVILSRFKELQFFLKPVEDRADDVTKDYQSQFLGSTTQPKLYVEATPMYLHGGAVIANRIASVLPEAKIMFVLRNPTDRVISYFRSSYGQEKLPTYGVEFDQFVRDGIRAMGVDKSGIDELSFQERAFRQELRISCYVQFLQPFVDAFGAENVLVSFFDQLLSSPKELMTEVCEFSGIDSHVYDDFAFTVENQTRIHRSAALRDLSGFLNARLEPILNRFPSVRRAARSVYDLTNVRRGQDIDIKEDSRQELEQFFAPWNAEFAQWYQSTYPGKPFPGWRTD